jgi:beta-glucanase (GH16 family)
MVHWMKYWRHLGRRHGSISGESSLSNLAHHVRGVRGLWPGGRAGAVAGSSVAMFLICMMLGLYLSNVSDGERNRFGSVHDGTSGTATTQKAIPNTPDTTKWNLVPQASMDFVGNRVDRSVWDVYEGAGNGGVGFRRATALSVTNGQLRIKAQGDVSGGLSQRFSQVYGRWVVRARMEAGQGYGPALLLWPDSEKWPDDGEIDFAEMPEGSRREALMTAHWGKDNSQASHGMKGDFTQWHTFTVDWLPDRLVFYIDGQEQWRLTGPQAAIPSTPMHLALQNDIGKCGDGWLGCRDASTPDTVSLYVSSVRVYSPQL